LAADVFLGDPSRFATGNQVASYIGMILCEHTRGRRQRLGKMTRQGNSLLTYLWTEATMHAIGKDPELKRFYWRTLIRKEWARLGSQRLDKVSGSSHGHESSRSKMVTLSQGTGASALTGKVCPDLQKQKSKPLDTADSKKAGWSRDGGTSQ
jgi:hypothetical protein